MSQSGQNRREIGTRQRVAAQRLAMAARPIESFSEEELLSFDKETLQLIVLNQGLDTNRKSPKTLRLDIIGVQRDLLENPPPPPAENPIGPEGDPEPPAGRNDETGRDDSQRSPPDHEPVDEAEDDAGVSGRRDEIEEEIVDASVDPSPPVMDPSPPHGDASSLPPTVVNLADLFTTARRRHSDPTLNQAAWNDAMNGYPGNVVAAALQARLDAPVADQNYYGALADDEEPAYEEHKSEASASNTTEASGRTFRMNGSDRDDGYDEYSYSESVTHRQRRDPEGSDITVNPTIVTSPTYSQISTIVSKQLKALENRIPTQASYVTQDQLKKAIDDSETNLTNSFSTIIETKVGTMLESSASTSTAAMELKLTEYKTHLDEKLAPLLDKLDLGNTTPEREAPASPAARRALLQSPHPPPPPTGPTFCGQHVNLSPVKEDQPKSWADADSDDEKPPPTYSSPTAHAGKYSPTNPYKKTGILKAHSPLNDPIRRSRHNQYLLGERGIYADEVDHCLDEEFFLSLDFGIDQHDELREYIRSLLQDWSPPSISPKYLVSFRKLETLSPEDFVDWYHHIRYTLARYDVGLVPFDCILIKWHWVGLCPPAVGAVRYLQMAECLYSVLESTLPKDVPLVRDVLHTLEGFHQDGYRLLDSLLARFMPVFCPSITTVPPIWDDITNVARMSKLWILHFRLLAKTGTAYSDAQQSLMFLDSIKEHTMIPLIASIKGQIMAFTETIDEFAEMDTPLPTHLTMSGTVKTLTSTLSPVTSSLTYASSKTILHGTLQGSINATVSTPPPNRRGGRRSRAPRRGNRDSTKEGLVCDACRKKNHTAAECRELGKLLILTDFIKTMPSGLKKKVLAAYKQHFGTPPVPSVNSTYAIQLEDFCDARGLSPEDLVDQFDWDHFCSNRTLQGCVMSDDGDAEADDDASAGSESSE